MNSRVLRLILIGMVVAMVAGEIGARLIEESLPELSDWPTLETQVKADQLEDLGDLPDVLVVGSSVTESGVDPAQLLEMGAAASAYNSAFPFYSPAALQVWLDEFIEPWGEVETLLIGLPASPPPRTPENDPLAGALEDLANRDDTVHPLDRFALWRLRGVVSNLDEALHRERAIAKGRWTALGHGTYWHDLSGLTFVGRGEYGASAMVHHQQGALEKIIVAAQQSGTTPVIVIEPGRSAGGMTNGAVEEYVSWLRSFADELGVELWDAHSVGWDPEMFADGTHFNSEGTVAYTRYIGEMLKQSQTGS